MNIGGKQFDTENNTYIMGILNVTPDSFSDGGKYNNMDAALRHAEQMVREGADILDVGGESTRPGHIQITDEEEAARVVPVIRTLKKEFDVPVSIDTYKSRVAEAALDAGADLVNDIWGLKYDDRMAEVIAGYHAACCLMHNRDTAEYREFLPDFMEDMRESVRLAENAGIREDGIILGHLKGLLRCGSACLACSITRTDHTDLTASPDWPPAEPCHWTLTVTVLSLCHQDRVTEETLDKLFGGI